MVDILFASCFLIKLYFLLLHIGHFDNIIILPLLVLETCGFMFFVYFLQFKQYDSILYIHVAHKIIQNCIIIFLKIIRWKKISIFSQCFSFEHKINKSNTKICAHYWILCLYPKNICFNISIFNKCFNFFRNMLYSKAIKISDIIIFYIQSNSMSTNIRILI